MNPVSTPENPLTRRGGPVQTSEQGNSIPSTDKNITQAANLPVSEKTIRWHEERYRSSVKFHKNRQTV